VLQSVAACCSVLQCVVGCCSVLQRMYCLNKLQFVEFVEDVEVCCQYMLQCVGIRWCSVLQCVAVCCSVLQCVAVCCSALQ